MKKQTPQAWKSQRRCRAKKALALSLPFSLLIGPLDAYGASVQKSSEIDLGDIANMSLESLMEIDIYSVSKTAEPWRQSAAASYVLTASEITKSGVKTVPDALRLIPGVTVARLDAHSWAITTRGFNSSLVDKLEVLMDGRSLYTPLYSGVYWQRQNIPVSEIERIEVIRGPGASLWGSNAVNGVINIITKSAGESPQLLVDAGAGNDVKSRAEVSTAMNFSSGAVRVYASGLEYDDYTREPGQKDGYKSKRLGFRSDWKLPGEQSLVVQGESYLDNLEGALGSELSQKNRNDFVQLKWTKNRDGEADIELRTLFEQSIYDVQDAAREDRKTKELELRKYFRLGQSHRFVLGSSYHETRDHISNDIPLIAFVPESRSDTTVDVYFQDQFDLIPDTLRLTLGSKVERNEYSGTEVQPSVRFAYLVDASSTLWGAVSRAVRIPTRLDENIRFYTPFGTTYLSGSEDFDAEELLAYELGYRTSVTSTLAVDVALFYNDYDNLRGVAFDGMGFTIANEGEGKSQGVETSIQWQMSETLLHRLSYTFQDIDYGPKRGSTDISIEAVNETDPQHQAQLHSTWSANKAWTVDSRLRYVDSLKDLNIPSYTELDVGVTWQLCPDFELSLLGQNLLDHYHPEFAYGSNPIEVPRSIQLSMLWRMP